MNHNTFAAAFLLMVGVFIWFLVGHSPELRIGEVAGQALGYLAIFTAWLTLFVMFLGGVGFNVVAELKKSPVALAVFIAGAAIGAGFALGH
jgi:hypothetical protein